jgi:lon-related putative ATP-dependent protease
MEDLRLKENSLKRICDPEEFSFDSTEELKPLIGTIGQYRADRSIDFGFKIKTDGFNLFVAGMPGTSKLSAIRASIKKVAEREPVPNDLCYVYNFEQTDKPIAIELPPGLGNVFAKDVDELIHDAKAEIPKAFEEEEYEKRKSDVLKEFHTQRDKILEELGENAANKGFAVELTPAGIITVPTTRGKPMSREEFENVSERQRKKIAGMTEEIQTETKLYLAKIRMIEKETKSKVKKLDQEIALFAIGHLLDDMRKKYENNDKVINYLNAVQEDIIKNLETFKEAEKKVEGIFPGLELIKEPIFEKYKVNLLIDNSKTKGAPIIIESNPTYYNLFGKLEYRAQFGAMSTSFTSIKPGAFHRANGGYLVINALDLLLNVFSYDALKRALKTKQLRIENIGEQFQAIPAATLRPEPLPLNLKVVIIGHPMIYHLLYMLDEDFSKLFKVKADFDTKMDWNDTHTNQYASLIAQKCGESGLKHFDKTGVARVVEFGARMAEDNRKLSLRIMDIEDLISEASYWASTNGNKYVTSADVQSAINEKIYRSNMIENKIQEMIEDGTILIDTDGGVAGQINGIAITDIGDYSFGKPSRITARTFLGRRGIVNIEREAKMSGRIHNKGVMILSGYLGSKYAFDKPLFMSCTVTFEQLYDEIEGDSASSSELYSILSSLADLPIKQGIAVTGSVNQRGEIQAIGGINQKIEGYFDVCKAKGLTGEQGVVMPVSNIKHLMLKNEVINAVSEGKFNIWAVKNVDEGIEVLTGVKAGEMQPDGTYPMNTVHYLANKQLEIFAELIKKFGAEPGEQKLKAA